MAVKKYSKTKKGQVGGGNGMQKFEELPKRIGKGERAVTKARVFGAAAVQGIKTGAEAVKRGTVAVGEGIVTGAEAVKRGTIAAGQGIVTGSKAIGRGALTVGKGALTAGKYGIMGLGAVAASPLVIAKTGIAGTVGLARTSLKGLKKSPALAYRSLRQGITGARIALLQRQINKLENSNVKDQQINTLKTLQNSYARKKARTMKVLSSIGKTAKASYNSTKLAATSMITGKNSNEKSISFAQRFTKGVGINKTLLPRRVRRVTGLNTNENKERAKMSSAPGFVKRAARAAGSALRITRGTIPQLKQLAKDQAELEKLKTELNAFKNTYKTKPDELSPEYGSYLLMEQNLEQKKQKLLASTEETVKRLKAKLPKVKTFDELKDKYFTDGHIGADADIKQLLINKINTEKGNLNNLPATDRNIAEIKINEMVKDVYALYADEKIDAFNKFKMQFKPKPILTINNTPEGSNISSV